MMASVVYDASLEVLPGELVAIVGANGAGKSTIMRTICGLMHPLKGSILFEGADYLHAPGEPQPSSSESATSGRPPDFRQALG